MLELLRNDPVLPNALARGNAQMFFSRATEVMHYISHIQHACSDAMVNFQSQDPPRHIRANPLVIQSSRSTYFQSVPINGVGGQIPGFRSASATRAPSSAAATADSRQPEASPRPASEGDNNAGAGAGIGEVEVNVEPIVVGIELEPDTGAGGARVSGGAANGAMAQNFIHQLTSMLRGGDLLRGAQSSAGSPAGGPNASSQDSQARSSSQTQPTTSTQTRSSAHVHYAPRGGALGINLSPMSMGPPTFDPLLNCNSHHIPGNNQMARSRLFGNFTAQRQRSASVPPRGNTAQNANQPRGEGAAGGRAEANSARSSPQRVPNRAQRPFSNLDFEVSTQIDVVPMVMAFGPPRGAVGARVPVSSAPPGGPSVDLLEPSLQSLLGNLQSSTTEGDNTLNVFSGILREAMRANSRSSSPGGDQRTISAFLESLPDYSFVEGESITTDLMMMVARNTTFTDLVNILMGSSDSLNGLQSPLREFVRRFVLVPPNDDEEHDVDAAVLHLVDVSYPHLEEMAREANVQPNVDFAETLHSFMAANLSGLAEMTLRESSPAEFGSQLRERGNAFLSRLTILCLRCFVDGNASLERVFRNRVAAISGDVGPVFQEWILSTAVGHLRNYVASINSNALQSEDVEQYFVRPGTDAEQRKAARQRRLQQHQTREDETFVTPRSSPPPSAVAPSELSPMEVESEASSQGVAPPNPSELNSESSFPSTVIQFQLVIQLGFKSIYLNLI